MLLSGLHPSGWLPPCFRNKQDVTTAAHEMGSDFTPRSLKDRKSVKGLLNRLSCWSEKAKCLQDQCTFFLCLNVANRVCNLTYVSCLVLFQTCTEVTGNFLEGSKSQGDLGAGLCTRRWTASPCTTNAA